jgi:N-methylhydantoinase B
VERLFEQTAQQVRAMIATWPNGVFHGEASLHNDAVEDGKPVTVRVVATIDGTSVHLDFSGSDDQTRGPYNIRPQLVRAVCYYWLKCLTGPDLPSNHGLATVLETAFRRGSVLDPVSPAPVNSYMPIALVTAEALFAAVAEAVPEGAVAESSHGGTAVTGTLSYPRDGEFSVQYEILAGAMGARSARDGVSATSVHVRNASITPIEIIETEYPVEVARFELVPDSGGPGRFRGGLGMVREYRMLGRARRTARGGRELTPPRGRDGGQAGRPSRVVLNPGTDGERLLEGRDASVDLDRGDVLRVELAGGGGYGDPRTRPPEAVLRDVREGYVTPEAALRDYGVVVTRTEGVWHLAERQTESERVRPGAQARST